MIKQFTVKNYKALESVSLPLTPIHVLIGQNDSGKTSLLEAIHSFCSSTRVSLPESFPGMWTGQDLVHFGSKTSVIDLSANDVGSGEPLLRYELGVDFSSQDDRSCRRAYERFAFDMEELKELPLFQSTGHRLGFDGMCLRTLERISIASRTSYGGSSLSIAMSWTGRESMPAAPRCPQVSIGPVAKRLDLVQTRRKSTLMSRREVAVIRRPSAMPLISKNAWVTGNSTWESCGTTSTRRSCSWMPDTILVLESCGEEKTDIGKIPSPGRFRTEHEQATEGAEAVEPIAPPYS